MNAMTGRAMLGGASGDDITRHLEHVDASTAAWRRLVFNGRADISLRLGETSYRLRFLADSPPAKSMFAWCIQLGALRGWFALETFDLPDFEAEAIAGLAPAFVEALMAEQAVEPLAQFVALIGAGARVVGTAVGRMPRDAAPRQLLQIENEANGFSVRAVLEQESLGFFNRLSELLLRLGVPRLEEAPPVGNLPARLALPTLWLDRKDATAARPGDVLIFAAAGTPAAVRAVCLDRRGARLAPSATIEGRTVRLTHRTGGDMADNDAGLIDETKSALGQASVPVTAVIGEFELPLRELGALAAGYVFELPTEVRQATVQLYTGRRRVGTGKLVSLGERLGVRLLEWGGGKSGDIEPA